MENNGDIAKLTADIAADPENPRLYFERGKLHYRAHDFPAALNDFNKVLDMDSGNVEARQFVNMINEILDFRYKDIYNP